MFGKSSTDIHLEGANLCAKCKKTSYGAVDTSSINLNKYIGNIDGVLTWGDKNFLETCRNVRLFGTTLLAECQKMNGNYNNSFIELNEKITNNNGKLEFQP